MKVIVIFSSFILFPLVGMRSSPSASDSNHLTTHAHRKKSEDDNHYFLCSSGASVCAKEINATIINTMGDS